jgi:hypothetical protein
MYVIRISKVTLITELLRINIINNTEICILARNGNHLEKISKTTQ